MNAEECPKHRHLIDEPQGIYYPWTCECPETCPCGYRTECGIWCGSGHQTGQCPKIHEIVHTDADGEQWCKECYSFACSANHCNCGCHLHPGGMCECV